MKRKIAISVSTLTMWCAAAQAATVHIKVGLIVCIDAEALESVADDWKKPGCVFHCLETSDAEVSRLREKVQAAGCYGKVSVAQFDGGCLPYINNLVNMVVIRDAGCGIRAEEVERVLLRALAKEPKDRYQSVDELVTGLDEAFGLAPMAPLPAAVDTMAPGAPLPEPGVEAAEPDKKVKRKKERRRAKPPRRAVPTPPPGRRRARKK